MRCIGLTLGALAFAAALPCCARAQASALRAADATARFDCGGGPAQVLGNHDNVTFTGGCRGLELRGEGNVVTIELASGSDIDIEGSGNRVRYTLAGGTRAPTLRVSGNDTDVAPGPGAPVPFAPVQPLALNGDNERLDLDCTGHDVLVQGSHSHYVLRGGCRNLIVRGNDDVVGAELQPGSTVLVEGDGTSLLYAVLGQGQPDVTARGPGTTATRGRIAELPDASPMPQPPSPPPPRPATAVAPVPPPPERSVPVLVQDLEAKIVPEGTLVTFPADLLFVGGTAQFHDDAAGRLAELVQLIRQINPSGITVTGLDPAASDTARERAAAVQAWLVGAGQVRLPVTTATASGPAAAAVLIRR